MTVRPKVKLLLRYIAANAYRARQELALTQEQVATKAGMEVSFYQRVERAKTNLSVAALIGISEALGVELSSMFTPAVMHKLPRRGRPAINRAAKKKKR